MEYEYTRVFKQEGQELTAQDFEKMHSDGWEDYFPEPEERLNFTVSTDYIKGEVGHAYIFRRLKR